ncbi:transporter substrate-binding domain-containing protein [Arenicellales bacterium nBUS_45]
MSTPIALTAQESGEKIRVGLLSSPPFVVQEGGKYSGLAVELWQEAAKLNNWRYEYMIAGEDPLKAVVGLAENRYDILLGDISPSVEFQNLADFTQPFIISHLTILYQKSEHAFAKSFEIIGRHFLVPLFWVLLGFVFMSVLFWQIELKRKNNKETSAGDRRVIHSGWLTSIAMLQGELPEPPKTTAGRVVMLGSIVGGIFLSAIVTAALTTSTTLLESDNDPYQHLSDVEDKVLLVEKDPIVGRVVKQLGGHPVETDSVRDGFRMFLNNLDQYDGLVAQYPVGRQLLVENKGKRLALSKTHLTSDVLTFAAQKRSPYINPLNHALISMRDAGTSKAICSKYLGVFVGQQCEF